MNIAFIPIDNRPVCYTLPEQICAMNNNIKLFMPRREMLGSLTKIADVEGIFEWFKNLQNIDAVVMCLDTIAYGGLIPSRRSTDTFEQVKDRVERFKSLLDGKKVYAFSSIMRISNNNINQEEKEYWNEYGKKIFEYSYNFDKFGSKPENNIPDEILQDYLSTRKRNFEINKLYLDWNLDTLIFSKDDCAEYGLNVKEARELEKLGGLTKTGADEIPLTLLARAVQRAGGQEGKRTSFDYENSLPSSLFDFRPSLKVAPIFLAPEHKHLISNYEDVSIEKSVLGQLELAGCEVCEPDEADILLYVNNFEHHQGEIVMNIDTKPFSGKWHEPNKPYMIADVRFANGADNAFIEKLFEAGFGENFCGYSAWNTSANTLGSLICGAVVMTSPAFLNRSAQRTAPSPSLGEGWGEVYFKKLQAIRFLDDWAYQANVRQAGTMDIKDLMKPFEDRVFAQLGVKYNVNYSFPWNRLFEVEVELN